MHTKTLYTVNVFSENAVGVLNHIATIFTRRHLNIETLSVSPSAIEGVHKFTITVYGESDEEMKKLVKQIDKQIDILKAFFNVDEDLVHQEIALYKVETEKFIATNKVESLIRRHEARILEVMPSCTVIEKTGHHQETQALFKELNTTVGVLQFIRSGRVAINKLKVERLSEILAKREKELNNLK